MVSENSNGLSKAERKAARVAVALAQPLPLSQRRFDYFFLFWWFLYIFTVSFTDLHNFVASVKGVEVKDIETMDLAWPPKVLTELYFKWARTVDPVLYENPMWWQTIEWMNLIIQLPSAFFLFWAFSTGYNACREWCIIVCSFILYSTTVCIGGSLYGPNPTLDEVMFFAVYQPYVLCPIVVIWRVWNANPFSAQPQTAKSCTRKLVDFLMPLVFLGSLGVFHYYCAVWMGRHTTYVDFAKPFVADVTAAAAPYYAAAADGVGVYTAAAVDAVRPLAKQYLHMEL